MGAADLLLCVLYFVASIEALDPYVSVHFDNPGKVYRGSTYDVYWSLYDTSDNFDISLYPYEGPFDWGAGTGLARGSENDGYLQWNVCSVLNEGIYILGLCWSTACTDGNSHWSQNISVLENPHRTTVLLPPLAYTSSGGSLVTYDPHSTAITIMQSVSSTSTQDIHTFASMTSAASPEHQRR